MVTTQVGACTRSDEPSAAPSTIRTTTKAALRNGNVRRYAAILNTLLLASSSAASATPSLAPRNSDSVGTMTSEPPSPADADTANDA